MNAFLKFDTPNGEQILSCSAELEAFARGCGLSFADGIWCFAIADGVTPTPMYHQMVAGILEVALRDKVRERTSLKAHSFYDRDGVGGMPFDAFVEDSVYSEQIIGRGSCELEAWIDAAKRSEIL